MGTFISTVVAPQPIQRYAPLVERALRDAFSGRTFPLYRLMEYQLGWRDERGEEAQQPIADIRLHSSLCLLACESVGGDPQQALPAAAAVELLHQFSQVHADIQDGAQLRHNRPTVWWIWGPAQAINAGDGLHALARLALMRAQDRGAPAQAVLRLLDLLGSASLRMCEGLHQELVYQEHVDITPDAYLNLAREKTGALLGCATQMGALSGGAGDAAGEAFRRFGEDLGVAYQVQEDIQALWGEPLTGKPRGADLLNKKKGAPVLLALDKAPPKENRELGTLFFKRVLEPPDLQKVTEVLERLDARNKALNVAREMYEQAMGHLKKEGLPALHGDGLGTVARWLALRGSGVQES